MSGVDHITVDDKDAGQRLDKWLLNHMPEANFIQLQKLMRKGSIRLDGKRVKGNERIEAGQSVRVPPRPNAGSAPAPRPKGVQSVNVSPEDAAMLKDAVLYKDDDVIVLNKPAGLPTQGGTGLKRHLDGMLDALRFGHHERPKLVHRLDKDTSGVLLIARTSASARILTKSFQSKTTDKRYFAVVMGMPKDAEGQISMRMDKLAVRGSEKMVATPDGKHSLTDFQRVDHAGRQAAWMALKPITGRTHQLRLHMSEIGHPIVGDGKYGGDDAFLGGIISRKLHLHARFISFDLPSGRRITVTAPLPDHMKATFHNLGFQLNEYEDLLADED